MAGIDQWFAGFWQWTASALTSPLGLVVLGGVATLAGGFGGSLVLGKIESRREAARDLAIHKAALRAVIYELTNNQSSLRMMRRQGSMKLMYLSDEVYNAVLLPLFSQLPTDLATQVAFAYGLMFALRESEEFGLVERALPRVDTARANLIQYARDLGVFMPEQRPVDEPGEPTD